VKAVFFGFPARMEEIWKDIPGFENYQVSNLGNVKSLRKKIIMKPCSNGRYLHICLRNGNIQKTCKIHKLVAEAFLESIEGKTTIDHINRDKTDNRVCNLRYANMKEQCQNRDSFIYKNANTCEPYIHQYIRNNNQYYSLRIVRNKKRIVDKTFKTLEEAIQFRDKVLTQNRENESSGSDIHIDIQ
jgi:hypothetical protein